jgi:hypothetical protein
MWKIIQVALMVIGAITVVLAIIVGVFIWNFTRPTAIEAEMHNVEMTHVHASSFNEKWDALTTLTNEETTEVILSEEEISSKLTYEIDEYKDELGLPFDVEKVWINLVPGSMHLKVAIVGNVFDMTVHLAGKGWVEFTEEDGKDMFYYKIEELDLGHAPAQLQQLIEDNIGDRMEGSYEVPGDWGVDLADVELVKRGENWAVKIKATGI